MRPRPTRRLLHNAIFRFSAPSERQQRYYSRDFDKVKPRRKIFSVDDKDGSTAQVEFFPGDVSSPPDISAHFGYDVVNGPVDGASEFADTLPDLRSHGVASGKHGPRESPRHQSGADTRHKACSCVHTSAPFVAFGTVCPETRRLSGRRRGKFRRCFRNCKK